MKKIFLFILSVLFLLNATACAPTMNDIIENEPHFSGIVTEVNDDCILVEANADEAEESGVAGMVSVSLDVQNEDSMTHFYVGDEVTVYYDGKMTRSLPAQVTTVYAITLINRSE